MRGSGLDSSDFVIKSFILPVNEITTRYATQQKIMILERCIQIKQRQIKNFYFPWFLFIFSEKRRKNGDNQFITLIKPENPEK